MNATDDLAAFGYKQELKRSLGLVDLLTYGLVFIVPIAPIAVFGIVFNASHGMVPLVYVIGLVAMVFIALSYMAMSSAFPVAGSVYSYTTLSLGRVAGFFAGWAILLDYILLPTLSYVIAAIALQSVFPSVSGPLCIVVMVAIATAINLLGIETTSRTSFVLLAFELVVLLIFCVMAWRSVAHHVAGAHFALTPFYNPVEVTPALIFGALSLAVLSFLGFDAISTLSEECQDGSRTVARATILALCLSAALFILQTWLASLFFLGRTQLAPGAASDGAFYDAAALAGGPVLKFLLAVPGIFISSLAGAVTAQAATARILFGMARDGELPHALAYIDPKRKVPTRTVLLVAAVTLVTGTTLVGRLELLTSMVSFGALMAFLLLQVSVVAHFIVRERSRNWLRYLVAPAIGFAIIAYVVFNAENNAKTAAAAWMAGGLVVFAAQRLMRRSTLAR